MDMDYAGSMMLLFILDQLFPASSPVFVAPILQSHLKKCLCA